MALNSREERLVEGTLLWNQSPILVPGKRPFVVGVNQEVNLFFDPPLISRFTVSSLTVSFPSSFRYVLISCHANYSRIYSKLNIFLMIVFVWAFSFGMLVPPVAEVWGRMGLDESTFSCTILK